MKLSIEHNIPHSVDRIEEVILAPETWGEINKIFPSIKNVKLIYKEKVQGKICLRKWFVPDVTLPWFAKGKIKPEMLEWGEMFTWSPEAKHGEILIEPNIPREWNGYFSCCGQYILKPQGENSTTRLALFDIRVSVPLFGGMAEGYVADKIRDWYGQEADALTILAAT